MIRWVPRCCTANRENGFVYVTRFNRDHYAIAWGTVIVDVFGHCHQMATMRCPACGAALSGLSVARLEVEPSSVALAGKRSF